MAKRGPKPIPTALKKLAGNPGKRPLPENEPQYAIEIPDCPEHLDAVATAEWDRLATVLHEAGVLTTADRAVMAGYCTAWSMLVASTVAVQKYGSVLVHPTSGAPGNSPYMNQLVSAMKEIRMFSGELGLSPASRAGVTAHPPEQPKEKDKGRFLKLVG